MQKKEKDQHYYTFWGERSMVNLLLAIDLKHTKEAACILGQK